MHPCTCDCDAPRPIQVYGALMMATPSIYYLVLLRTSYVVFFTLHFGVIRVSRCH